MKKLFTNNKVIFNFILLIPIINALADVLTNYYPPTTINPGSIRAFIILMLLVFVALNKAIFKGIPKIIPIFLIYLALLIPFSSSNIFTSFISYIHIFIPLMMFPLGFHYIRTTNKLKLLNTSLIIAASIICFSLTISQIYKLGGSAYVKDTFYIGGAGASIANSLAIIILIGPSIYLLLKTRLSKIITTIILIIAVTLIIINFRRGAIISLFGGLFLYGILMPRRIELFKYVIPTLCILFLISHFFAAAFQTRFEVRTAEKQSLQKQARYIETLVVWDEFRNKSLKHSFLGSEPFNSAYYFGRRSLHVDYNVLLHGTGIIGLSMYLLIYLTIIKLFIKYNKLDKKTLYFKKMRAVFFSVITAVLLIGFSRGLGSIGLQSILFVWLGAIIGISREQLLYQKRSG